MNYIILSKEDFERLKEFKKEYLEVTKQKEKLNKEIIQETKTFYEKFKKGEITAEDLAKIIVEKEEEKGFHKLQDKKIQIEKEILDFGKKIIKKYFSEKLLKENGLENYEELFNCFYPWIRKKVINLVLDLV